MKLLTTRQVIVRIVCIVSIAEFLVMLLLDVLPLELSVYEEAALDLTLLALLSTPMIYIWVVKPFVTARDEALDRIIHLAHTDPLTQLPNRRLVSIHLEKFLAEVARREVYGAVLLIDLDGFKAVNDDNGHDSGDEVLKEIAKRLQSNTRSEDVAGRLGGDEFIVLLHHLDTDERIAHNLALQIAEKLIDTIKMPVNFNGAEMNVGASIGIRLLGSGERDAKTTIAEADAALYRAKQAGRGRAVFFEK